MEKYYPAIAIGISILGWLVAYFKWLVGIQDRLARLETKTELFWKCVEGNMVALLKTYPTCIEKDVLLDKMQNDQLTKDEAFTLRTILSEEMKRDREKAIAYILLIARLEQKIYDLTCEEKKGMR
jgi:hypothetical protein